jgi:hypothetical protein
MHKGDRYEENTTILLIIKGWGRGQGAKSTHDSHLTLTDKANNNHQTIDD